MLDTRGCVGCDYWRTIGWHGGSGQARRACHYCLDTGHCRSLICGTGYDCTVRSEKGVIKLRQPTHKYDSAVTRLRVAPVYEFYKLYRQGLWDEEIAARTGAATGTVVKWRLKCGLKSNRWLQKQMEKEQREQWKEEERQKKGDPCLRCNSREVCQKVGGTCNEKERWTG